MWSSGVTYLLADCCFSELALYNDIAEHLLSWRKTTITQSVNNKDPVNLNQGVNVHDIGGTCKCILAHV